MAVKLGNGKWAVKENKLLAYNDNSGRFFNKEFDFARGSIATYVGKDGLIKSAASDVPRIDFKDNTKGALLLEPTRTNLWTNSNLSSSITLNGLTRTLNQSVSPSGDSDANLFNETATTGTHRFYRLDIPSTSTDFSMSFFAKKNGINIIRIVAQGGTKFADFDLSLGIVNAESGVNSSVIEDYGNGWYRCIINVTASGWVGLYALNDSSQNSYLGNVSKGVYLYGAQLEEGSYATSYIPTSGSATTRLADVCNNSGSAQDFNSEEGVLYAEIAALANDGTFRFISLKNNTTVDIIRIGYITTSNRIEIQNYKSGVLFNSFNYEVQDVKTNSKIAFKWKDNDFQLYINGLNVLSNTSVTAWGSGVFQSLQFDQHNGGNAFYGNTRDLRIYNTALTDQELIALTTI